jgi:hypothetical protein
MHLSRRKGVHGSGRASPQLGDGGTGCHPDDVWDHSTILQLLNRVNVVDYSKFITPT